MKLPLYKMKLNVPPSLFIQIKWSQDKESKLGEDKKALESSCEMKFFSSCWPWSYVIRVLMISNYKLQIQQKKLFCCHPAVLLQMPAKIASSKLRNKSQISNHNFANLKLQITKKEGVRGKLVIIGKKALSSSMKLSKRRKMRKKTQKKPTKLTSLKKKLRKGKECPWRRKYDKS